jgi:gliding motility-associated-like protein
VVYANPTITTTYTVTGTTSGCTASTTVLVTVTAGIIAEAGPDTSICIGGNTVLTASGGNTYAWSPSTGLSCTNCASPTANPTTTTTYTVTVSSGTCIPATDQVTVTVVNPPVPSISGITTICSGTPTTLTATGGSTYQWSTSEISSFITVSPTVTNTYTLTVSNGACTASATVTVNVNPAPMITAGTDTTIILGQSVNLWSAGGINYNWSPIAGLSCINCPNPVASPTETTIYYVTGIDSIGCTSVGSVIITIDMTCGDVFIPNAFSPNGDGVNDVLYVHGNCIKSMKFSIFDRWGERVFECENPETGWDGKKNGLPMNSGVFVYYLRANMMDKTTVKKQGNITLFR